MPADLYAGWLIVAGIAAAAMMVNALTVRADYSHLTPWKPWVWEGSSTLMLILLAWIPWLGVKLGRPERLVGGSAAWGQVIAAHACAVLLFSALHVAGMVAVRQGAYAFLGAAYRYPIIERFIYEFRKDLLTYALFAAVFWLAGRLHPVREWPAPPARFDIRDGARMIRAPVAQILAATSAGNYVQFVLADGRRPMMRATLAGIEAELGDAGFVRTHRSWLVNARRMTGLRPEKSGNWTVELDGAEAPLSRRYSAALARLRDVSRQ